MKGGKHGKIGDVAEDISRKNVESDNWFILVAYDKVWILRDGLKKGYSVFKQNLKKTS